MTMMILAAITDRRPIMFIARSTLRMIKPGPASRLLVRGILGERREVKKLTKSRVRLWVLIAEIDMTHAYKQFLRISQRDSNPTSSGIGLVASFEARLYVYCATGNCRKQSLIERGYLIELLRIERRKYREMPSRQSTSAKALERERE